jgi:diaminopimelate decarboxylase
VYSKAALTQAFKDFSAGLIGTNHLVCFAVKANPNIAILNLFAKLGAGFDIVSGGELARVLAAGCDPQKIVFSGVGKSADEMRAALNAGIFCFNVESASELNRLNKVAGEMGKVAPVSLRVNPNVDAKTHPYISTGLKNNKFGVAFLGLPAVRRGLCRQAFADPKASVGPAEEEIASLHLKTPGWAESLATFASSGGFAGVDGALPSCELQVLWGANDRILPAAQRQAAAARLGDDCCTELKSCGHLPHLDQPTLVASHWRQSR